MVDFLKSAKALVPKQELDLPEVGMTVFVHGMTARDITEANKAATKPLPKGRKGQADGGELDSERLTVELLARSLHDKDGKRLIPEGREDEINDLPYAIINKITAVVFSINGMKAPENIEGN